MSRARATLSSLIAMSALPLIAGCVVGSHYRRPSLPPAQRYSPAPLPSSTAATPGIAAGAAQSFSTTEAISAQWWTLFRSPELNRLIGHAFAANPTIDAAVAALKEAQENVYAQRGYFYPTVQVSYQGERTRLSGNTATSSAPGVQGNGENISPLGPAEPVTYNFHTAQLTVGYVPDVFGANRRQVESLQAQADAARYQLDAAYVTLASNVVAAAIQEASTRAQIAAVRQIIRSNQHSLRILRNQRRLGYAAGLDVAQQELALAQAQALLPPLTRQLAQTRDLIRALAGNAPDEDVPETFTLAALHLPEQLPLSLPSHLIEQRPDVLAAEEQVRSASAQVGVAVANRLPQFALTAALGGQANRITQMFWGSGTFWSVLGSASQPLFDAGTLRHRQNAAEQALAQSAAQYRSTVLTAFQNVADTLQALYSDADALRSAVAVERAARVTLHVTQEQFHAGYANGLAVLTARQAYQQAVIARVQAQAARLGDTAALFEALGGGWWNEPPGSTLGQNDRPLALQ
ncbi:MAG TPA: efflux transporter outer membrane subunit [Steroidobacteraceae bacterium]|nr:efflux transporter outer membrane subunit [Steroidobacteraceae bacterium]